jgi:hypothetical protein
VRGRAAVLPVPPAVVELLLQARPEIAPLGLLFRRRLRLLHFGRRRRRRAEHRGLPPLLLQQHPQPLAAERRGDASLPRVRVRARRGGDRRGLGVGLGARGRGGEAREPVAKAERAHARRVPVPRVPPAPRRVRLLRHGRSTLAIDQTRARRGARSPKASYACALARVARRAGGVWRGRAGAWSYILWRGGPGEGSRTAAAGEQVSLGVVEGAK